MHVWYHRRCSAKRNENLLNFSVLVKPLKSHHLAIPQSDYTCQSFKTLKMCAFHSNTCNKRQSWTLFSKDLSFQANVLLYPCRKATIKSYRMFSAVSSLFKWEDWDSRTPRVILPKKSINHVSNMLLNIPSIAPYCDCWPGKYVTPNSWTDNHCVQCLNAWMLDYRVRITWA